MPRTRTWMALVLLALMTSASSFGQAPSHRPDLRLLRQPVPQRPVPMPAMPRGPQTPVSMDQLPAAAPHVSYQDGMLTIVAQNSTLGDILREVHKHTGAVIEVPPNATERVATRLGPGPAPEVLASLLNGSAFNYVMVGSTSDPRALATVVLTAKPGGAGGQPAANQPPPQYVPPDRAEMAPGMGPGGPVVQQPADEEADAEDTDAEDSADADQAEGAAAQDGSQPNAGPKTPEQILEMLRKPPQMAPGQVAPGQIPRPNQQPPDNNE